MPTYEYICQDCKTKYDIFHKAKEITADVICPSCGSMQHRKVMSVTAISMGEGSLSSFEPSPSSSCETGSCCGGACNVN